MSLFHFLKFVMNFLKGVVSICHSFQITGQPGRINSSFKLSIDAQLGAIELLLCLRRQILKFYQLHTGKQKQNTSITARTAAKAVDSFYARICLRTSNLLDSYHLIKETFLRT